MRFTPFILGAAWLLSACQSLPYREDVGFLVASQAGSPEYPTYLNGKLCTDMEGYVGACAKRVRSREPITFKFDPQPYNYTLVVKCTQGVVIPPGFDVEAGREFSFQLKPEDFSQFKSFTCIGEVSPQDRDKPVSGQFHIRFIVIDAAYTAREVAYLTSRKGKNYLVLGQYARSAWVYDTEWRHYDKRTVVEVGQDTANVKAYSESYAMRFNYFNMGADDSGVEQP